MSAAPTRVPPVAAAAGAMIVLQLVVRAAVAFGGYFYWDDLILVGRAGTLPLLSATYLFNDHDGHVMPGAFLLGGLITRAAPLVWMWPAVSLLVLQLLASLSLLRTLHIILGWRPLLLLPLGFALFTPLALPSFAWWAAALNYLPLLAALAWVCGDAILLIRTGSRRYAVTGTAAYLTGLLFFEKCAVIPFVAFTLTALLCHVTGGSGVLRTTWRKGRTLWASLLVSTAGWVVVYLVIVDQQRWTLDVPMTWDLLRRSVTHGVIPGIIGGPWQWQRWAPASPWAVPPPAAMIAGWVVLGVALVVSLLRKRRITPVWLAAAGYVVACQAPVYLMRSSAFTALELAQTLRYLADLVWVLALLAAVAFLAPARVGRAGQRRGQPFAGRDVTVIGAVIAVIVVVITFLGGSLMSTVNFLSSWRDNPTKEYLRNAAAGLALARASATSPMLDQDVDPLILQRVVAPENLVSHMFALLRDRPEFARHTDRLRMLTSTGTLVDADVTWVRSVTPGPLPQCGYFVETDSTAILPLDGPLLPAEWTAELNYLANTEGSLTVSLPVGPETRVPVKPGLNRVFVRLSGAGDAITVRAITSALTVCLASGPIGYLAPHRR